MYTLGIDLGGTNIAVGVVDESYRIVGRAKVRTNASRPDGDIIADMAETARAAVADAGLAMKDIAFAGIAAPGSVNPETGVISYANNLPFRNTPVAPKLSELLGLPCHIDNDANVAAYGELLAGAGKGAKNFVAVTLGTGVGGGIIVDGKIYSGFNYAGAELGHMIIVYGGETCSCGTKGCWEAYASASALIRQTVQAMEADKSSNMWEVCGGDSSKVNGRTAFDAMRAGDAAGAAVVDRYIGYIACGVVNIINVFQPEFVCIGGGICNEGDTLLKPLRDKVYSNVYNKGAPEEQLSRIIRAELGNDAGIIGAAMLGNN